MQGVLCSNIDIKKTIENYLKCGNVVISTYVKNDLQLISEIQEQFPDVVIIDNDLESYEKELREIGKCVESSYFNNTFYQLKTTLAGIKTISTDFIIKTRVDHSYSNMDSFIQEGLLYPEKILSSSLFVRGLMTGTYHTRYHMSDCLFMGRTDLIRKAMNLAQLHYTVGMNPESMIWRPYVRDVLQSRENNIYTLDNLPEKDYLDIMGELFHVFSAQRLEPYQMKLSYVGIETRRIDHYPEKTTLEYLQRGVE
jgi:hypothetical protein